MSDQTALTVVQPTAADAPLLAIAREDFVSAVDRLKAILPDGAKMSVGQLSAVAMHSILTGTLPGTDVHYFLNGDKLCKVDDYKLLKRWAIESERKRTGDQGATILENYALLTEGEADSEGLQPGDVACWCTIVGSHDQGQLKGWIDAGLSPREALELIGTKAIGVVKKGEAAPKGWSPMQKARKLALKSAIRFKYGQPSVPELQAQMRAMAHDATEADWQEVPADLPPDAQVRYASLVAQAGQVTTESAEMTTDQHRKRLSVNRQFLRGDSMNQAIGEDEPPMKPGDVYMTSEAAFYHQVLEKIPYYRHVAHVRNTLVKLGLSYADLTEDALMSELEAHAQLKADTEAGQPALFVEAEIIEAVGPGPAYQD